MVEEVRGCHPEYVFTFKGNPVKSKNNDRHNFGQAACGPPGNHHSRPYRYLSVYGLKNNSGQINLYFTAGILPNIKVTSAIGTATAPDQQGITGEDPILGKIRDIGIGVPRGVQYAQVLSPVLYGVTVLEPKIRALYLGMLMGGNQTAKVVP